MKEEKDIFYFKSLQSFPGVVHGISTKAIGDMHQRHGQFKKALEKLSVGIGISTDHIVCMDQVHGKNVTWVTNQNKGKRIDACDGLVTAEKNLFLCVVSADCVPILLYENKKNFVGAVHAGWRGIYSNIIAETIKEMVEKGADLESINVYFGPSICSQCYCIDDSLAAQFRELYPKEQSKFLKQKEDKQFLDLMGVMRIQLARLGIVKERIVASTICTKEDSSFFSHRRDHAIGKCGVFASVIGMI